MVGKFDSKMRGKEHVMGGFPCAVDKRILLEERTHEISNEFQNLKKWEMSVNQYTTIFTRKMELVPYMVPTELSNVKWLANGLPTDFKPTIQLATTLDATIQFAKSLEDTVKGKSINQGGVEEKWINEGS